MLVIDDSEDDVFLFRLLLKRIGATAPFMPLLSSRAAMGWLETLGTSEADRPFVCFLDLHMPHPDGFAVLEFIRSQRQLDWLPVIMLSSSEEPEDINRARDLGAQAYASKYPSTAALSELLAHASVYTDGMPAKTAAFQLSHNLLWSKGAGR
jgi:CheY-like chemotaxis protein